MSSAETLNNQSLPSGLKRRKLSISQMRGGDSTAGESPSGSNPDISSLCLDVKNLQSTMDSFSEKLGSLESKMSCVLEKCSEIVERISLLDCQLTQALSPTPVKRVIFNSSVSSKNIKQESRVREFTESSQIIKLNSLATHPSGSWLGDPGVEEQRVRVGLDQQQLDTVNTCPTPEKMALALLELLFGRDTLAQSNLTGKGKHRKKQLDPLLIFGIYCHLKYKFDICEIDWARIKNNMDAKCRFFWSRKHKVGGSGRKTGTGSVSKPAGEVVLLPSQGYWLGELGELSSEVLVASGAQLLLGGEEGAVHN